MIAAATTLGERWTLLEVDLPPGTIPLAGGAARDEGPAVETVVAPPPGAPGRWGLLVDLRGATGAYSVVVETTAAPVVVRVDDASDHPRPGPVDLDYRARDFEALRTTMLEAIADAAGGRDTGPVPQTTAVVELLAFLADGLGYVQDAIATEAYLTTARRRVSGTRHAALLDYPVREGSNARTWVRLDLDGDAPVVLPRRTQLLTRVPGLPLELAGAAVVDRAVAGGAVVFETMEDVTLHPGNEVFPLREAAHPGGALPAGATSALVGEGFPEAPGRLVVIEKASPPPAGHVVRLTGVRPMGLSTEIAWATADALPTGLADGEALQVRVCNLVLADEGRTLGWRPLPPPRAGEPYGPVLPARDTTFASAAAAEGPATAALEHSADPGPAVVVEERSPAAVRRWRPRPSLLESDRASRHFVVEVEEDGSALLRFGDGVYGAAPAPGAALYVRQRVGLGPAGNVAAGTIAHVVATTPGIFLSHVENVVAARGGTAREPLSSIRVFAPRADLVEERVVTRADYRAAALDVAGVVDAEVRVVSTGLTERVTVSVHTSRPEPSEVLDAVRDALAPRVLAGRDVDVRAAVPLPVHVDLDVALAAGTLRGAARPALEAALQTLPATRGFGRSLRRSDVTAAAGRVDGVVDARVTRMTVAGRERDVVKPRPGEVVRVARVSIRFSGGDQ